MSKIKVKNATKCEVGVVQVGQIYGTQREPNPQAGRIYDAKGISPCLDAMRGGNRMPKVIVRPCLNAYSIDAHSAESVNKRSSQTGIGDEQRHLLESNDGWGFWRTMHAWPPGQNKSGRGRSRAIFRNSRSPRRPWCWRRPGSRPSGGRW